MVGVLTTAKFVPFHASTVTVDMVSVMQDSSGELVAQLVSAHFETFS